MSLLYPVMDRASDKIRSTPVREAVQWILVNSLDNAHLTVDVEKAAPAEQLDDILVGSIVSMLSSPKREDARIQRHIDAFFAKFAIRA